MADREEYRKKWLDPRWQKVRLRILERDDWKCRQCGAIDRTLNVHHLWYESTDPWDAPEESLAALCRDCHEAETESLRDAERELITALKRRGLMARDLSFLAAAARARTRFPVIVLADLLADQRVADAIVAAWRKIVTEASGEG
jgi:hypothetical protein